VYLWLKNKKIVAFKTIINENNYKLIENLINMITKRLIRQVSEQVIGAAIEVHRHLGPGLLEEIYKDAMIIELSLRNINFEVEKNIDVYYKDHLLNRKYKQDLVVENLIIVELKAIDSIHPIHKAKLATYMLLNEMPKGLLLNFNVVNITKGGLVPWVNHFYNALPD